MGMLRSLPFVCAGVFGLLSVSLSAATGGPKISDSLVKSMHSSIKPTRTVRITFDTPPLLRYIKR